MTGTSHNLDINPLMRQDPKRLQKADPWNEMRISEIDVDLLKLLIPLLAQTFYLYFFFQLLEQPSNLVTTVTM